MAGATDYLGHSVVQEQKKRKYWVRVLIRNKKQKERFKGLAIDDYFIGQVTDSQTIKNITKGIRLGLYINWHYTTER
ncbi:hypothetical protein N9Y48_00020 [Zobellia sp.]|nr:hypothetical protein [Zobellia sp.]